MGTCEGVWSVGEDETPSASETIIGVLVIVVCVADVADVVVVDEGFERELGLELERGRRIGMLEDRGRKESYCEMWRWLLSSPSAKVAGGRVRSYALLESLLARFSNASAACEVVDE